MDLQLLLWDLADRSSLVFQTACGGSGNEHHHDDLTSPFLYLSGGIPKLHAAADLATLVEATRANNLGRLWDFF